MTNSELIYPVFLNCCQLIQNTFWKYIFEDLAYANAPYGTYITKNFLCCSYKNKEFNYKIEETKEPKVLLEEIKSLLINRLGLLSQEDRISHRNIFDNINTMDDETNDNWQSIKKKGIKNILIENYVIKCKAQYQLTVTQTKSLLSSIILGTIFKTITSDDIEYQKGKILNINCFQFKNKKFYITKNLYEGESTSQTNNTNDKKKLSDIWQKYITTLTKF